MFDQELLSCFLARADDAAPARRRSSNRYSDVANCLAKGEDIEKAEVEIMMIRPDNLRSTDDFGKPFKVPAVAKVVNTVNTANSKGGRGAGAGGGRKGSSAGSGGKSRAQSQPKRKKTQEIADLQDEAAKRARTDHPLVAYPRGHPPCPPLDVVGAFLPQG